MKKGFTLVELLVVIGMISVLIGGAAASFARAREQAKIAKATADVKEITNAILAYENYTADHSLESVAGVADGEASKSTLGFIVGDAPNSESGEVPVLYNAQFSGSGKILDPWGRPYRVRIQEPASSSSLADSLGINQVKMSIYLPNMNREVQQ